MTSLESGSIGRPVIVFCVGSGTQLLSRCSVALVSGRMMLFDLATLVIYTKFIYSGVF